ncbi:hypothetical protein BS78_K124300 [Paspalum vaginatum]|uniref:No apical meristem-associated C-terminal domain-containing protein n=1 Tax=Paspalum vaginatum TaxID=158149 RepID=A0A9W7X8K1_9POAL|nr:hypothetical protein BS78_K124300 [Paspalum vaginatum]
MASSLSKTLGFAVGEMQDHATELRRMVDVILQEIGDDDLVDQILQLKDLPDRLDLVKAKGKSTTHNKGKGKANHTNSPSSQGGAHRIGNYTQDEDLLLCSAYINVSHDPIVGTNQSQDACLVRITQYYHEHKTFPTDRNKGSLQHRWNTIQPAVNKFCGIKAQQDRLNESGHTEESKVILMHSSFIVTIQMSMCQLVANRLFPFVTIRIQKSMTIFWIETNKDFLFRHCWEALRQAKKWEDYTASKAGQAEAVESLKLKPVEGGTPAVSDSQRPMGRDAAKKQKSGTPSDSESQCLEVLQQMMSSRKDRQEANTVANEERNQVQRQKLELLKEQTALQYKHAAQRDRELNLREEENEMRIINMDLSSLPSEAM